MYVVSASVALARWLSQLADHRQTLLLSLVDEYRDLSTNCKIQGDNYPVYLCPISTKVAPSESWQSQLSYVATFVEIGHKYAG